MPPEKIKLASSEGEVFDVDIAVAKCSGLISQMLENLGLDENEDEICPLPNVSSVILQKVIKWAEDHRAYLLREDDGDSISKENNEDLSENSMYDSDMELSTLDRVTLFELTLAANYLDIKELLDATSKVIANLMKHKQPEEIRQLFNIENDLSLQEAQQIQKENEWIEAFKKK